MGSHDSAAEKQPPLLGRVETQQDLTSLKAKAPVLQSLRLPDCMALPCGLHKPVSWSSGPQPGCGMTSPALGFSRGSPPDVTSSKVSGHSCHLFRLSRLGGWGYRQLPQCCEVRSPGLEFRELTSRVNSHRGPSLPGCSFSMVTESPRAPDKAVSHCLPPYQLCPKYSSSSSSSPFLPPPPFLSQ